MSAGAKGSGPGFPAGKVFLKAGASTPTLKQALAMRALGDRLKGVRQSRGLTQDALSDLAGVPKAAIVSIETLQTLRSKHFPALCEALKVSYDDLVHADRKARLKEAAARDWSGSSSEEVLQAIVDASMMTLPEISKESGIGYQRLWKAVNRSLQLNVDEVRLMHRFSRFPLAALTNPSGRSRKEAA